ncbi:hypothetical protein TTHERM_00158260 (macronuclear) [Tetrahymena thermophila SB210]|uniref:Uncharacterized protein n=1 Tax=Tetrahymena thermophila (strain SB210) TaxID=312017 RepID=Q22WA8_TETTS|nr:hypothetical protein TTHERM_00158260 [Tetrahymena thermophila SB210]EAR89509.2 hypothetical protein TTHERM_00158260 [Tetrahymena thermophila SB210]|eukprot:XP_001009754.2 hypothetical protein TTHERM_00158260 [Tetrahymena thermophila SB210]
MNFFQHSNEPRSSLSSGLSSSSSQYRTSFLEETPKHQNLKDERIRNIKSKLQSIPSQNNKYDDNSINLFNIQHSSLSSQSYTSQNQNINNINLLQNPLYQSKSNSNNFIQPQQKSYLGTQVNMERKQKAQIRGSIRSENEEEQSLISMREKNALFFEEDESRRRSFTPSQSQSSSNESFTKNQHAQKAGGFFGNKLQEIKLRRFQIDAAKLIIDRLVKVCYKSFNDIYEYSQKNKNRNSFNNPNINKASNQEYFKQQAIQNNAEKSDKDLKLKIVNNKTNQLQNSSSLSHLQKKFEQDICLSDRKQHSNSQNIIQQQSQNQLNEINFTNSKNKSQQSQNNSQYQSDNLKINDRKLSIQINLQNSKPLYRHISPCDRLSHQNTTSSQISTRNRNVSSIITNNNSNTIQNNNNNNYSSSSFHFSMSQNNNFNCSPSGQFGVSNNYQQNQNQQYFQQLSNSFNNLESNLRRASSHENKMILVDNSFENGFRRQKSSEKIQLINSTQCNSQERNTNNSTFSKMIQQFKSNNNKGGHQVQQNVKINNENNSLFSHKTSSGFQKQNNSSNTTDNQYLRPSPQRKSTGGYIQNNVSIPKSFLDSSQKPLQRQSHSSQHLNSYFQTSFFKQNINEDSSNSQHNIHNQIQNQSQNQDKLYENCLTEQSFFRMSTNGTRNPTNNNGDLLSVRINTNESNNYNFANTYTNRGSYRESEQTSDIQLTSSFQKSINNQLRQEIENRRSFKNQKQDSLDCIFDDLPHKNAKKGGSLIECEEEDEMKVSSIQKLKQEFNEIIKSSFQNEVKSSSFKKEEQQKIVQSTSNRVSFNNENEEQNNHNIYNQNNILNRNNNINNSTDQNQQIANQNSEQNNIKQKIQDQFQAQLIKQQQLSIVQRGQQDERSCISARNNTSAFIVENLLNQEEVKSFSCYDEDLIKQQDITIQQLSTKNQNVVAEQSNFKDDLIFDKTVHSFDFNLSLRESENNLKQKLNMQQDLIQSPNQNQAHSNQNTSQKRQLNLQDEQIEIIQENQNIQNEQHFDNIQQNISQLQRKENVQFNGSFGRLSVDSTPRNNEDVPQLDNSKKPLSYFARQQSDEEVDGNQNEIFLQQNSPDNQINNHLNQNQENLNLKAVQQNASNKFMQQQQQNIEGEEGDEESSRFSFELKNTLDEFQSQHHLEQILFNQNNQTTNEDISIIEKNNKSNFSIFIDKNDRNNMSIFNSNNEELLNTVTNSQINLQQHNLNNQHDNILIAQSFPYSSSGHNFNKNEVQDFNDISFDQNQHHLVEESNKKQYFENTKKAYQEDNSQRHFGETKKQLFMDSNHHLTQSNDSNDQNNDANLMIITQIIQGNSLSQECLRANQLKQKEEGLEKFKQKIYFNDLNEAAQNQQVDLFDDEQILFEANEFTPPRQKKNNPINQYPMHSNAESSPIIDKEIVQGGLGLKVFEFSLKMQTILKAIQMKNVRESFISIVIYSQLKSYLMSAYQQQLLQQQLQNDQLQAQRVAQIQNIPYYYQSQFSTIYEQQNETCSDIHQPQSINASKLLDSRSLYDSKSLEQFNLEMNKVTVFNSLQFTQNQIQNASSQHITHSSIIESNVNNSQNTTIQQPSQNMQNVMHTEIVTEIDSNDNGIKQFWGLSIISSKLQNQLKQAFNCWKNSLKIKENQNKINNLANDIQICSQNQLRDAFDILKKTNYHEDAQNFRVKIIQLSQTLERLKNSFMRQAFLNLKINSIQRKAIFEQQMRYSLHSVIQIVSNAQQDNIIWSLQQLKKQTINKTKLINTMNRIFKQKVNQRFLDKLKQVFALKKRREFALQPVLFNYRRFKNQLLSKYLERWRMQLYHKSSHFDKFTALSNLSNIFKQNIQTSIQLAYKKIQLNSLISTNKEKFLKNILLQVLIHVENKKKEQKQIAFEKIVNLYTFKKHRESVLQNLIKSKIIKEQHKYFHLFYKRVYENKNHVQFIKTGIKSLLLMGQILQGKISQNLLYAFKSIQFFNLTKRKISSQSCSTIDLLNSEHESIKQTLKNLKNNLQKVKIESLIKGFSHAHQKIQYNLQKTAFRKILQNCRQKQKICKGLSVLQKFQDELTKKKQKVCFARLKYLIQDKLQLKKNQKSQKQIFCIFLKTLLQKKLQNQKRTALLQIKERAEQYVQDKRDKKLIYTESSMFVVKCKLLLGTLDRIFKKNLYQYPFQLIYGCQPQKYIAALQFYQNIANQAQKTNNLNQNKKQKTQFNQNQQQQNQVQKNFHASNLLNLSKSKSPMKKIQEQHNVKHEIIKNLVNKNDEQSKQQNSQTNNNNKKDQLTSQKGRVNQNLLKAQQNQIQAQNDQEKNKPKTSQSQIIPSQNRNQNSQLSNINAFKSQIITPTNLNQQAQSMNNIIYQGFSLNQIESNDKVEDLSLSSKGKCITFGGSSSPKQRDFQNKQNTSIPNINNISNFMLNQSPNSTERIITSSSNIKSPQNSNSNKQQVVYDIQKQQQHQINLNSNQKQLPYFQHNRNYSSGSIPSSLPITNTSMNQSSSIILYNSNNTQNQNQYN